MPRTRSRLWRRVQMDIAIRLELVGVRWHETCYPGMWIDRQKQTIEAWGSDSLRGRG